MPEDLFSTVNFSKVSNFGKVGIIDSFSNFQIDISHVQNGIYVLKIETETGVFIEKIITEKNRIFVKKQSHEYKK